MEATGTINGATDSARRDGRNARKVRTRASILAACREMMAGGAFQPPIVEICRRAGCSVRSGFDHFSSVETLRLEALEDPATKLAITMAICGVDWSLPTYLVERIIHAAVFGRPL